MRTSKTATVLGSSDDSWYATKEIMLSIEKYQKIYYCPLKDNRQVDDSNATQPYRQVDALAWTELEKQTGKLVKIKGFPGSHKVKLFRVGLSTQRTDYVVTNDMAQDDTQAVQEVCSLRCGRSSSFTEKPSNSLGWKAVSVAKPELFEIILPVPF